MHGVFTIFRKELSDNFSSYRFIILFALISMVSLVTVYIAGSAMKKQLEGIAKPGFVFLMLFTTQGALFSLTQFIAFFGPLIGLVLGFDSINREKSEGTMIKLVSQSIYRDSIINGKFLAGLVTVTIMLISIVLVVTGLGLRLLGVIPGIDEILRMIIYLIISVVYISFWLGIAIFFSIMFRSIATSALAAIAIWIFFSFFVSIGASVIANSIAPVDQSTEMDTENIIRNVRLEKGISLVSPMNLYSDATAIIIDPLRKTTSSIMLMGPLEKLSSARFQGPLPLIQSIYVVLPYITTLIAITIICFAISYAVFMRQEIRSS